MRPVLPTNHFLEFQSVAPITKKKNSNQILQSIFQKMIQSFYNPISSFFQICPSYNDKNMISITVVLLKK